MKRSKWITLPLSLLFLVIGIGQIIRVVGAGSFDPVNIVFTSVFDGENPNIETEILGEEYGKKVQMDVGTYGGHAFAFWVVNGAVREDLAIDHLFTVTSNMNITALFHPTSPTIKHAVLFMDSNGKLLDTQFVENGGSAVDPSTRETNSITLPTKPGLVVAEQKWKTLSNVTDLTNITSSRVYVLQYEKETGALYNLQVTSGTESEDGIPYNEVRTIVANPAPQNMYFSHWEENGRIVSRQATYTFTMLSHRSLTAVYSASEQTNAPFVSIGTNLGLRDNFRSYIGQFSIPSGYDLVEYGYLTHQNYYTELTFTTIGVNRIQSNKYTAQTNEFLMSFPYGSHQSIVTYMVVKAGDVLQAIYSPIAMNVDLNHVSQPLGNGDAGSPYLIASLENLNWIAADSSRWNKHYRQTSNIDASETKYWHEGAGWNPIGVDVSNSFIGTYDGNGYVITGLRINRPNTNNVGLFGHVGNSTATTTIKNLGLENVEVFGARGTGTLIGRVTGQVNTTVINCYAKTGKVVGDGATGGLVGSFNSHHENPGRGTSLIPVLSKSYANINVEFSGKIEAGKDKFGGLTGCTQKGRIENSYAMGSVTANGGTRVGGLTGCIDLQGEVINVYSTGNVSGTAATEIGGLVGRLGTGFHTGGYWNTETSEQATSPAGVGKTTNQMKTQGTYINWDFTSIWNINSTNEGYPYLR